MRLNGKRAPGRRVGQSVRLSGLEIPDNGGRAPPNRGERALTGAEVVGIYLSWRRRSKRLCSFRASPAGDPVVMRCLFARERTNSEQAANKQRRMSEESVAGVSIIFWSTSAPNSGQQNAVSSSPCVMSEMIRARVGSFGKRCRRLLKGRRPPRVERGKEPDERRKATASPCGGSSAASAAVRRNLAPYLLTLT